MLISKTRFINYIRCDRFVALDEIHKDQEKAIVSFSDSDDLEALMHQENSAKIKHILDDMTDEDGEDVLVKSDPQMDTMLKYYNEIEMISGQIIDKKIQRRNRLCA